MRHATEKIAAALFFAAANVGGCLYKPPPKGADPLTYELEGTVREVAVFSGPSPEGIVAGQAIKFDLTFTHDGARLITSDSTSAVYTLARKSVNTITAQTGPWQWKLPLHQVLLYDNAQIGDRFAINSHGGPGYAFFDFRDSTMPYDLLSGLELPHRQGDLNERSNGGGGGMASYEADGSDWRLSFSIDRSIPR